MSTPNSLVLLHSRGTGPVYSHPKGWRHPDRNSYGVSELGGSRMSNLGSAGHRIHVEFVSADQAPLDTRHAVLEVRLCFAFKSLLYYPSLTGTSFMIRGSRPPLHFNSLRHMSRPFGIISSVGVHVHPTPPPPGPFIIRQEALLCFCEVSRKGTPSLQQSRFGAGEGGFWRIC